MCLIPQHKAAAKKVLKLQRREVRQQEQEQEERARNSRHDHPAAPGGFRYSSAHARGRGSGGVEGVVTEAPWGSSGATAAGFDLPTDVAPAHLALGFGGFEKYTNGESCQSQ